MKIYYSTCLVFLGSICSLFASPSLSPSTAASPSTESSVIVESSPPAPSLSPPATDFNTPDPGEEDLTHPDSPHSDPPDTIPAPVPTPFDEGDYPPVPSYSPLPTDTDPNALIPPPAIAEPPRLPPQFAESQKKEEEAKELVKYKAMRVKAEKNPAIQRMYAQAQRTSTEEDYRAALRTYYRMLFKKIEDLDPSLAKKAQGMRDAYLRKLAQTKIEPTIPLRPPPRPESLAP